MVALITIKTTEVGCRKFNCQRRGLRPHRHHRGMASLFRGAFVHSPKKRKSKEYRALVKRYDEYHPDDIVLLCPWHHCEIHKIYDELISAFAFKVKKRMRNLSWGQAADLMMQFEEMCKEWEKEDTPGLNPVLCNFEERDDA